MWEGCRDAGIQGQPALGSLVGVKPLRAAAAWEFQEFSLLEGGDEFFW